MTETIDSESVKEEIRALRGEVAKLNGHRYIRIHDSIPRMGLFQLYRGLAFGLGSVLGGTIVVSVAAFLLSQIDFIPIIGDWATDIAAQIDSENAESYGVEAETENTDAIGDPMQDSEGDGEDAAPAEAAPSPADALPEAPPTDEAQ